MSNADLCLECGQATISTGGIGCICNKVECSCGALVDKVSGLCTKCWNTKERR